MNANEVKEMIKTNEFFVLSALQLLYSQQTAEEKEYQLTEEQNGRGFNATDAAFCSSLAEQNKAGKELTFKQMEALRKILPKYSKQISVLWKK